ncbi:MAG: hypothetical protein WEB60_13205 [Terrimicrobiaceae bacterium]
MQRNFPSALRILALASCLVGQQTVMAQQAAQETEEQRLDREMRESSEEHMRLELGVNDITAPSIAAVLKDLGSFQPVPLDTIAQNNREAVYANRMQTAIHFGSLVADGFMLTIAERTADVQDIGKALIRQSRSLGVSDRLTKRSKSLFELSEKGDWIGMREELARTQSDVEKTMLDLRDEEMAHMISLGGWLRGFQLAAKSCAMSYSPDRSRILARTEIIDYYLDRLDTLHPRLKKTDYAVNLTTNLRELKTLTLEAEGGALTQDQTLLASQIADRAVGMALGPVDAEGRILKTEPQP